MKTKHWYKRKQLLLAFVWCICDMPHVFNGTTCTCAHERHSYGVLLVYWQYIITKHALVISFLMWYISDILWMFNLMSAYDKSLVAIYACVYTKILITNWKVLWWKSHSVLHCMSSLHINQPTHSTIHDVANFTYTKQLFV